MYCYEMHFIEKVKEIFFFFLNIFAVLPINIYKSKVKVF